MILVCIGTSESVLVIRLQYLCYDLHYLFCHLMLYLAGSMVPYTIPHSILDVPYPISGTHNNNHKVFIMGCYLYTAQYCSHYIVIDECMNYLWSTSCHLSCHTCYMWITWILVLLNICEWCSRWQNVNDESKQDQVWIGGTARTSQLSMAGIISTEVDLSVLLLYF